MKAIDMTFPGYKEKTSEDLVRLYLDHTGRFNRAVRNRAVEAGYWSQSMSAIWKVLLERGAIDEKGVVLISI